MQRRVAAHKNAAAAALLYLCLFIMCFSSFCVLPAVPQGERRMLLVKTLSPQVNLDMFGVPGNYDP
jgi:hypothetical protein